VKPALRAELVAFLEATMQRVHAAYPVSAWCWIEQGPDQGYPPDTCLLQVQFVQGFDMDTHFPVAPNFICTEAEIKAGSLLILRQISLMVGTLRGEG
jgi:hypothetical protein